MAKPCARRSSRWSPLPLSEKRAQSSSFNQWQQHLQFTFAALWALIYKAAETTQDISTNKQWLLCSHCQYFWCSPARAPVLAPSSAGEPFNQPLKDHFRLTQSLKSNHLNARIILIPLKPVILTKRLPTWFHERTSAPNRLNALRGLILLKRPSALHHGLK